MSNQVRMASNNNSKSTTDVEYKQGIYTERTQHQNSEKTDPTSNDIALEMDLIFDENLTMLISLGIPSNFTMIL